MVLLEGWCVGFRSLGKEGVQEKWEAAKVELAHGEYLGKLAHNTFEDLRLVDEALKQYDALTESV